MNVTMKRSLLTSIIFGMLFIFLLLYFLIVGAETFISVKIHQVVSASVFLFCFTVFVIMLLFTNKRGNIVDERDAQILRKANSVGLLMSLIYVFLLSIILFIIHRNDGVVSVSWLWFIAYSSFSFGYFITSFINFYLHHYED